MTAVLSAFIVTVTPVLAVPAFWYSSGYSQSFQDPENTSEPLM